MSEVVVVGAFVARDGKEDEATAAFQALVEPTHAEDGCILYALHRGNDDPRKLAFVERWESRELLAPTSRATTSRPCWPWPTTSSRPRTSPSTTRCRAARRRRARSRRTPAAEAGGRGRSQVRLGPASATLSRGPMSGST